MMYKRCNERIWRLKLETGPTYVNCVKLVQAGERKIRDQIFYGVNFNKDQCFAEWTTNSVVTFLSFGDAVAKSKRSLEKLFILLDMYEVMRELQYELMHAGGTFGGSKSGYSVSGGLHGVALSVVNALSELGIYCCWGMRQQCTRPWLRRPSQSTTRRASCPLSSLTTVAMFINPHSYTTLAMLRFIPDFIGSIFVPWHANLVQKLFVCIRIPLISSSAAIQTG